MGLDIYVGSLTRYYCEDWQTSVQKWGLEQGVRVQVVRPTNPNAISDPVQVGRIIELWRRSLAPTLRTYLHQPLMWNENPQAPYFTDKPAYDGWGGVVLWAAYEEQPHIRKPADAQDRWFEDRALLACQAEGFDSRYKHLTSAVEIWLPVDMVIVFEAENPAGVKQRFGSSPALLRQLAQLNQRTWRMTDEQLNDPKHELPTGADAFERAAWFGFSMLHRLARLSVEHRLPMLLDG